MEPTVHRARILSGPYCLKRQGIENSPLELSRNFLVRLPCNEFLSHRTGKIQASESNIGSNRRCLKKSGFPGRSVALQFSRAIIFVDHINKKRAVLWPDTKSLVFSFLTHFSKFSHSPYYKTGH